VFVYELRTAAAQDCPEDKADQDRIIELARHWNEVGHKVERHREVRSQGAEEQLVTAGQPTVASKPRKENGAVGDEARQCARCSFLPREN
jgi:hypothetical protein